MADNPSTRRDPRRVLGVSADAEIGEIRRNYVDLARRYHPDRYVDAPVAKRLAAQKRMQEVNEAWRQVREPSARPAAASPRPRAAAAPRYPEPVEYGPGLPPIVKYGPWGFLVLLLIVIFVVSAVANSRDTNQALGNPPPFTGTTTVAGQGDASGEASGGAAGDGASSGVPVTASANARAVIGQCVEVLDGVVIAPVACTPAASGTLEAGVSADGRCNPGSEPVFHRALGIGMCLKPWSS